MSRILNRQRQLAEQGRLRLGYTLPTEKGVRPVKSETWVLTSHSEEHIQAAAALWGGKPERWQPQGNGVEQWRVITTSAAIDAILPPGEPLTQTYEQWSKGGCQVRCDGVTEQFSGNPCLCLAKFGDQWYERNTGVCDSKSRLKVLLPDMPGLGVWRMETGSFYATDEIAGMVDTIRAAVGDQVLVPVQLRIEARTRVAAGQTKQFVVPVLELRGVTAGALLAGHIDNAQIGGKPATEQITSGPAAEEKSEQAAVPDYLAEAATATTVEEVRAIWRRAKAAGHLTNDMHDALGVIDGRLKAAAAAPAVESRPKGEEQSTAMSLGGGDDGPTVDQIVGDFATEAEPEPEPEPVEGEIVDDDADAIWAEIVKVAGKHGLTLSQIETEFGKANCGCSPATASAGELRVFLDSLQKRAA